MTAAVCQNWDMLHDLLRRNLRESLKGDRLQSRSRRRSSDDSAIGHLFGAGNLKMAGEKA
ncbi:MAG TPA: hypothetical protein VHW73_14575 [Rudaea sp.]|jgi:hypothetical protein|nr:hypothetical protein [Rudaea sp.]